MIAQNKIRKEFLERPLDHQPLDLREHETGLSILEIGPPPKTSLVGFPEKLKRVPQKKETPKSFRTSCSVVLGIFSAWSARA